MATPTKIGTTVFTTPSDIELEMMRVFDAPPELLWEAHTNPEHPPHWMLGPEGWTMPVCEIDLRPGGEWHFVWRRSDGTEMELRGVYKEIAAPERLVTAENRDGDWPGTVNELTLTEADDRTTLTSTMRYPTEIARNAALDSEIKDGAAASFDRLGAYLDTIS